ncbi:MAG TPA: efflux transporter outer membrane subunit [Bryobacteraceae bacterium]|nr:efflux transporter outer membrane subunit [Bryobacteraceae bacterium]
MSFFDHLNLSYWKNVALSCAIVVLALLSACNPAPKYVKPSMPAPVAYKETGPQEFKEGKGWKIAQPGDDKLRSNWWELYNDPVLNTLEEQVSTGNQSLAVSEANFRSARTLVASARSSLFPTIGATPSFSNTRISSTIRGTRVVAGGGSTSSSSAATNNYNFPLDVSYTVDFWHRIRNTIAANAFSAQASAADVATALLSLQSELATDYFEVRAIDAQESILQDTLKNYGASLNLTIALYRAGIDSEQDVTQAEVQLDTANAQLTDLGTSRAQFEHAIAMLIGKSPANFTLPPGNFNPNPPPVPVALPSVLLERRPDIAAFERQVASANAQIGVARAAYYPNVTLSASGGFQTSSFTQWFTWPSRLWSVGPTASETLYDAGARRAQVEQTEASYDAAVANYRQTVLTAFQAVEDNLANLRILNQEIDQQQTAIASSAHYLDLALIRYKTGVDSYLNVITAQTTVLTNRETQVQTQLREMAASVALIMALGGGWDPSQLPDMKNLLARPPAWHPGGPPMPNAPTNVEAPNPPAVQPSPLVLPPYRGPVSPPASGAAHQ